MNLPEFLEHIASSTKSTLIKGNCSSIMMFVGNDGTDTWAAGGTQGNKTLLKEGFSAALENDPLMKEIIRELIVENPKLFM